MARGFLNPASHFPIKHFDIRVEEDHLILRGTSTEASSVVLKGKLVLCALESFKAQGINMCFTGVERTSIKVSATSSRTPVQETKFFEHEWSFGNAVKKHTQVLPAGNHEWPFELVLDGNLPESIEGLSDSWIIYRMKATVERGILKNDSIARQHIRIIRTFDQSSLELSHSMSVESIWPEKLMYNISTPTKGVALGNCIQVSFVLVPLLKGLKIGKVESRLHQKTETKLDVRQHLSEKRISSDVYDVSNNIETQDINGQDGYSFTREVPIPRNLQKCVQTVAERNLKIKHEVRFTISLHNPDEHISELRATLPVHVFISPNVRLNVENEMVGGNSQGTDTLTSLDLAPPGYGEHQFDQLYSDVDPSSYMTPTASGFNTPFGSGSSRASNEDLASLGTAAHSQLLANTLHNRLNNLTSPISSRRYRDHGNVSGPNTPSHGHSESRTEPGVLSRTGLVSSGDYFNRRNHRTYSRNNSTITGQESSDESSNPTTPGHPSDQETPRHLEYNSEALSKVPSYGTALRSRPPRGLGDDLPDYEQVLSRSQSPIDP